MGQAGTWSTDHIARTCAAQRRDYHIGAGVRHNMRMRNRREELIGQLMLVRERLP